MNISSNNILYVSIYVLIFIGLFNDSQFGASFSWVLFPAIMSLFAILLNHGHEKIPREHYIAIAFWIISLVSTIISPVVDVERNVLSFILFTFLFIFMTPYEREWNSSRKVILVYIIVSLAGAIMIISNFMHGIYYNEWFQRSTVTFMGVSRDPNYVAGFIAPLPILAITYKPIKPRKLNIVFKVSIIVIGLVALFLNGSRGGIISAVIPIAIYLLLKVGKTSQRILAIFAAFIICIIGYKLIITYLPEQTVERLFFKQSTDTRSNLWVAGLNGFFNNPIIGQGIGCASYYSKKIVGNYSHNMYIDILSGMGLLGFFLYILIIVKTATCGLKLKKCLKNNIGLIAISFFLPQFFINGFNTLSMWIPLIMVHHLNVYCMDNTFEVDKVEFEL